MEFKEGMVRVRVWILAARRGWRSHAEIDSASRSHAKTGLDLVDLWGATQIWIYTYMYTPFTFVLEHPPHFPDIEQIQQTLPSDTS